jgi:hypothetical protein
MTPQTLIVRETNAPDIIWNYEKKGYILVSMKRLDSDINIYVLQFFKAKPTEKK